MPIVNVTLEDILRARDTRANAQRRLLRAYRLPLVSFTMNIAGPVKSSPLIELAFDAGLEALYDALGQPAAAEVIRPATGCEALLVYDRPAAELKAACLTLETAAPIGRLYDLDVLDTDGSKLSRPEPRTCLICGGPVTVCCTGSGRSRSSLLPSAPAAVRCGAPTDFCLFPHRPRRCCCRAFPSTAARSGRSSALLPAPHC